MIGGGRIKFSDQFYSAPSRVFAPIWYICGIMPHYGIFVMIRGGGYKLLDHLYSTPLRVYAPIWYICQEWEWGV